MRSGLIQRYEKLQFQITLNRTLASEIPDTGAGAELTAGRFSEDDPCGIWMTISSEPNRNLYTLSLITLSNYYEWEGPSIDGATITLTFDDIRWYFFPSLQDYSWRLVYAQVTFQTPVQTLVLPGFDKWFVPYEHPAVPFGALLLGPGVWIHSWSAPERVWCLDCVCTEGATPPPTTAATGTTVATTTGGWRFYANGAWHALPVAIRLHAPPAGGSCCLPTETPTLQATDTFSGSVNSKVRFNRTDTECEIEGYNSSLCLLPSLNREIKRVNSDFGAYLYRAPFPEAKAQGYLICTRQLECQEQCRTELTNESIYYPQRVGKNAVVQAAPHSIETEVMNQPVYAPYRWAAFHRKVTYIPQDGGWVCQDEDTYKTSEFPVCNRNTLFSYYALPGDLSGRERWLAIYLNTIANPHWSYFYDFPPDEDRDHWLLGSPLMKVLSEVYWYPLRQQYLYHSTLPEGEQLRKRNFLIDPPLGDSDFQELPLAILGRYGGWVGLSRFQVQQVRPTTSTRAYNSSSSNQINNNYAENCTVTLEATRIRVDPASSGPIAVKIALTDFFLTPYFFPAVADKVTVGWDASNVASISVYLQSADSDTDKVLIATSPGTYSLPRGMETTYAGTWARSLDVGLGIDIGRDLQASGRSGAMMGSSARVTAHQKLQVSGKFLRFEIDVLDRNLPVRLYYPSFAATPTRDIIPLYETANDTALIFYDSNLVRYGAWDVWSLFSLNSPPDLRFAWERGSLFDWMVWRRLLFEGVHKEGPTPEGATLADEIRAYFDGYEGNEYRDVRFDTYPILLPMGNDSRVAVWLVNVYREIPPLCWFPRKERDSNTWQELGSWVQYSYAYAQLKRYLVHPSQPLHLYRVTYSGGNETGRELWTGEEAGYGAWRVTSHQRRIMNDEAIYTWGGDLIQSPQFHLRSTVTEDLAHVTPWHGYFGVSYGAAAAGALESDSVRGWLHVGTGKKIKTYSLHQAELAFESSDHPVDEWRRLREEGRSGILFLLGKVGDSFKVYSSTDGGILILERGSVVANSALIEVESERGWLLLFYEAPSGNIYLRRSTDGGANWSAPIAVQYGAGQLNGTLLDITYDPRGAVLVLAVSQSGNTKLLKSSDGGESWSDLLV